MAPGRLPGPPWKIWQAPARGAREFDPTFFQIHGRLAQVWPHSCPAASESLPGALICFHTVHCWVSVV